MEPPARIKESYQCLCGFFVRRFGFDRHQSTGAAWPMSSPLIDERAAVLRRAEWTSQNA
jgi:hypothetical protein